MRGRIVILTNQRLSVPDWKKAIEAQDYLVPFAFADDQPEAATGRWHAWLDGQPMSFLIREVPVDQFAAAGPSSNGAPWLYAFAAIDESDLTRMSLAIAALFAYAAATGGVGYDGADVRGDPGILRQYADMHLAAARNLDEAFGKRYGQEKPVPGGRSEVHIHMDKN